MSKYKEQHDHPVPVVNAIVRNEKGEILLVRRHVEPNRNKWTVVGGRLRVQDDCLESAIIREVKTQTGLDIEVTHLLGVLSDKNSGRPVDPRFFVVKIIYVARVIGGSPLQKYADDYIWRSPLAAMNEDLGFNYREVVDFYIRNMWHLIPRERSRHTENYGRDFSYITYEFPRVACMAIILNEKKELLMGLRGRKPYMDHWNFPGGHMYVDESPEETVKREVREELGVDCRVGELFHVYSDKGQHPKFADVGAYYFTTIYRQDFIKNVELVEFKYYSLDNLPEKIAYKNRMVIEDIKKKLEIRN